MKMKCPFCNSQNHRVVAHDNSMAAKGRNVVKRYRKCLDCGKSFATIEDYAKDYSAPRATIRKREVKH